MKYNRICQITGIEKPVIQGPLSRLPMQDWLQP